MADNGTTERTAPDTIVLVHGFWVTPRSWEGWIAHYEGKGYRVIAPAYPGLEVEVEALREDPSPIEALTIPAITDRFEAVVDDLDSPPIIIGHSAGLAVFRYQTGCGTVWGHTGNTPGYTQFMAASPDGKRSVVVSVNAQLTPVAGEPGAFETLRRAEGRAVCAALAGR